MVDKEKKKNSIEYFKKELWNILKENNDIGMY